MFEALSIGLDLRVSPEISGEGSGDGKGSSDGSGAAEGSSDAEGSGGTTEGAGGREASGGAPVVQAYLCGDEWIVDSVSRGGEHKVVGLWRYDKGLRNGAPFVYLGVEPKVRPPREQPEPQPLATHVTRSSSQKRARPPRNTTQPRMTLSRTWPL
eukprot:3056348-Prymnesium_polylepis.1